MRWSRSLRPRFAGRARMRSLPSTYYVRFVSRLLPCFETLASLAPQHEVVVFQRVRPHPEEVTNGSRECAPDDRLRGRLEGWAAIPICALALAVPKAVFLINRQWIVVGQQPELCLGEMQGAGSR